MGDLTDSVRETMARVTVALPGGGEEREGQLLMAEAVALAIEERKHLIVQASTGTGKTLAYLVPAILLGVKCVVSTATSHKTPKSRYGLRRAELPS